eukprot:3300643-Rhodomonas_salina.3
MGLSSPPPEGTRGRGEETELLFDREEDEYEVQQRHKSRLSTEIEELVLEEEEEEEEDEFINSSGELLSGSEYLRRREERARAMGQRAGERKQRERMREAEEAKKAED